jgi:tetratricopeptide (TPR) repeat protein
MSARLDIALDHHRAGRLVQAIDGYRAVLAAEPGDATAEAMLGVALSQSGDPRAGLARLRRAVALAPGDSGLAANLGACLDGLGARTEAGTVYLRAAALSRDAGPALAAAGACLLSVGSPVPGLRSLRRAIALSPGEGAWWAAIADGSLGLGRAAVAVDGFRRAASFGQETERTLDRLADALLRLDRAEESAAIRERHMARVRASRWYRPDLADAAGLASASDSFRVTSEPKLRHDIQQIEYLIDRGVLPRSFAETAERYRRLLAASTGRAKDGPCFFMTEAEQASVAETYNRVIHLHRPRPVHGDVLNTEAGWEAAEERYAASDGGIVVIDDLLASDVLSELRRLCLESTFWFDDRHLGGYLGAMLRDGFCDPLLLRISRALARRMPRIFRDLPLQQMWAYKYDSRLEGTALHADAAAVNVNFWITPDEANLSEGRGGLVVFDKRAPADWEFEKFNNDQAAIRSFLEDSGARSVVVPYRCNRAVIFHSDLFHRTDDLFFRDDYASRRINVTMLFGQRGA